MRGIFTAALIAPLFVLPIASPASATCARVPSDFNGDGYGDLAVGAPQTYDPIDDTPWQGALHVAYGSADGIAKGDTRSATFTGHSYGMPAWKFLGSARLGEALASGYFDGDCYADLAVSAASSSNLLVLYGSQWGLSTDRAAAFDRTSIQPDGAYGSGFSSDLAAGDFDGDGFDDIAAGAPWTDDISGAVGILYGSTNGITSAGAQWITQDSPHVPGVAEKDDRFGFSVAVGDFNGDGWHDLAVGTPFEAVGSKRRAGGVNVFPGTPDGLTTSGATWWDQDSPGVAGAVEAWDRFGHALVAGDTNGDGRAELVVGVPDEGAGGKYWVGMVNVFRGSATGLVAGPGLHQDTTGVPNLSENGDRFGSGLALVDLNRDGKRDLAVGAPGEAVGTVWDTGAVTVLYSTTSGPSGAGATYHHQNSAGVPGANENQDAFGRSLSRLPNAYGGDALVISAPNESAAEPWQGAVTVLPSAPAGASRPTCYVFSGANFPGGAVEEAAFGVGLP